MSFITEMQISLEDHLRKKVKITSKDGENGTITIDFYSRDDLTDLADRLTCY